MNGDEDLQTSSPGTPPSPHPASPSDIPHSVLTFSTNKIFTNILFSDSDRPSFFNGAADNYLEGCRLIDVGQDGAEECLKSNKEIETILTR